MDSAIPPSTPGSQPEQAQPYEPEKRFNPIKLLIIGVIGLVVVGLLVTGIFLFLNKSKDKKSRDEKVTLTYWTAWEDPKVFEPLIDEFEKENPNITVNLEVQDIKSLGDYIERLSARIQKGGENAPDIYRFHNSWTPQISHLLLPLPKDVIKSLEIENQYYSGVKKAISYKGAYFGVPLYTDNLALFVNRELLEFGGEPVPTEWIELLGTANKLTTIDQGGKITQAGAALGTYENVQHASDIVSLILIQSGVDLLSPVGPKSEKVFEVYSAFAKNPKVWDKTLDNSKLAFAKGTVALFFGYSWDILGIRAVNPALEYDIVPVPHIPTTNQTVTSFWIEGVSSATKHPDEAFQFLSFLGKKESLEKLFASQAQTRGPAGVYPRKDLGEKMMNDTLMRVFVSQAENSEPTPFSSDTFDNAMVDKLNNYMKDAINSSLSSSSYQTATGNLKAGVDQTISQYAK